MKIYDIETARLIAKTATETMAAGDRDQTHEIKIIQPYFTLCGTKTKTFELRKNDRDYKAGDILILREWDNEKQEYTGRNLIAAVSYCLYGSDETETMGLKKGFAILSIEVYKA